MSDVCEHCAKLDADDAKDPVEGGSFQSIREYREINGHWPSCPTERAARWRAEHHEDFKSDPVPAVLQAEVMMLRKLLWLRHGCSINALYGDDGEMSCSNCRIDFKRIPVADIEGAFRRIALKQMEHRQ